jgi:hypothetical protein
MAGMDLKNMRENGATSLDVYCSCGHHAVVDVSAWHQTIEVQNARMKLRCSVCDARPNRISPE